MKGLSKKVIAFAAVTVLTMTSLVGCKGVDDSEIVATVGDSKITAGMANFYARYQQPSFEEYYVSYQNYQQQMMYGSVISETVMDWSVEQEEGVTLEDTYKDDVMTSLQNLYIMEDHVGDYDIALTEDELTTIDKAADTFIKANSEEARKKISADKETVTEFLKLMTISTKVDAAIRASVDTNIPDEEAAQKRLRYVSFETTKTDENSETTAMTDEEIATVKEEANTFLAAAKENGSLESYAAEVENTSSTATYGANYAEDEGLSLPKEVYEAADKLEENGFAEIVETESAIYVVQLESTFDTEATAAEKEAILTERQDNEVTDTIEKWRKDTKIEVNEKVWKKISMQAIQVTAKEAEDENTDDVTTDDSTSDDGAADDGVTDDNAATDDTMTEDNAATDNDTTDDNADASAAE